MEELFVIFQEWEGVRWNYKLNISIFLPSFPPSLHPMAGHMAHAMVAWELQCHKHDLPCFALLSLSFCCAIIWHQHPFGQPGSAVLAVSLPASLLGKDRVSTGQWQRGESLDTVKALFTVHCSFAKRSLCYEQCFSHKALHHMAAMEKVKSTLVGHSTITLSGDSHCL